jgi:hypothetical protein
VGVRNSVWLPELTSRLLTRHVVRRLAVVLALVSLVWLVHRPLLRGLARPLISDERQGECDAICLHGTEMGADGDRCYEEATARWQQLPSRSILLIEPQPRRLSELGAVPSFEAFCRSQLGKRSVAAGAVRLIPGRARDVWDEAHVLGSWLEANPGRRVSLLCNQFSSRRIRYALDHVLGPEDAARVDVVPLTDRLVDEDNWWRSRQGVKNFMFAWLGLIYTVRYGEQRVPPTRWSVAEYEEMLQAKLGDAP